MSSLPSCLGVLGVMRVLGALGLSASLLVGCALQVGADGLQGDDASAAPDDDAADASPPRDSAGAGDSARGDSHAPPVDAPRETASGDAPRADAGPADVASPDDAPATSGCPDWRCTTAGCTDLVAFPGSYDPASAEARAAGYYLATDPRYTYLRRDLGLVVRHAACEVAARFPGTAPLGLQDMSQVDGMTPGTDVGAPRHPTTTHKGSDIDISYYQTDGDNDVQIICGDGSDTNGNGTPGRFNDGYFCTVDTNIVDWDREVWLFAKLADTPLVRVFGVDQTLPGHFTSGADDLLSKGLIDGPTHDRMSILGYGASGGWQFHHHHTHMSYKRP